MKKLLLISLIMGILIGIYTVYTLNAEPVDPKAIHDYNCPQFSSWQKAQAFYEANHPDKDPYHLDRNRNGVACEALSGSPLEKTTTIK